MHFQLIALKPLDGCDPQYLKNLQAEEIYKFLDHYEFNADGTVSESKGLPERFFSKGSKEVEIQISAIVGKNGSGKSALVELLLRIINNVAIKFRKAELADLVEVSNLRAELYYLERTNQKSNIHYYCIRVFDKEITVTSARFGEIPQPARKFDLREFFYSIAINYSFYAFATGDMSAQKGWIKGVFHKNDGYQTPLVIHPFRRDGNMDINSEDHLVISRIIANLTAPGRADFFRQLTEYLFAYKLTLTLAEDKGNTTLYNLDRKPVKFSDLNLDKANLLRQLAKVLHFRYSEERYKKFKKVYDYMVYKMVSIAIKYYNEEGGPFFDLSTKDFDKSKIDAFFTKIDTDFSHVTLKLRQSANYLRFPRFPLESQDISLADLTRDNEKVLKGGYVGSIEPAALVPPPVFKIEIILRKKKMRTFYQMRHKQVFLFRLSVRVKSNRFTH